MLLPLFPLSSPGSAGRAEGDEGLSKEAEGVALRISDGGAGKVTGICDGGAGNVEFAER